MKEKGPEKRLIVWLPESLHREVKTRAAYRGMKMKEWVIMAIAQRLEEEKKYE